MLRRSPRRLVSWSLPVTAHESTGGASSIVRAPRADVEPTVGQPCRSAVSHGAQGERGVEELAGALVERVLEGDPLSRPPPRLVVGEAVPTSG